MNTQESSIDILKKIAHREQWQIDVLEKKHSVRYGYTNRVVIIRNPAFSDAYFISAQNANYNKYNLYSGIFIPVAVPAKFKLILRNRNPLDQLSFIKNKTRFKIGSSRFDKRFNIVTNNDIEVHKLFSSAKVQDDLIEFMKKDFRLIIGINEINPNLNDELKGKSYLSVFIATEWILDKEIINEAFIMGKRLKEKLN